MKPAGIILIVIGLIGTIIFGIKAINNSQSADVLGVDVAVSSANWTPVIVSVLVLVVGIVIRMSGKK